MFAYSRVGVYLKGFNSYPAELVKRAVEYFFSSVYIRLHMHKKGQNEVAGGRFISEKCLDTNNVEGEIQMWVGEREREKGAHTHTQSLGGK